VWRAYDGKAQRDVALKVLHGQFAEDRSRRDRFFRGAWKMSELQHPGVVEVVEPYGEENGFYYFVMEYLRDGTLHSAVLEEKIGRGEDPPDARADRPGAAVRALARAGPPRRQADQRAGVGRRAAS
jgi:serine/threonine protein kinase